MLSQITDGGDPTSVLFSLDLGVNDVTEKCIMHDLWLSRFCYKYSDWESTLIIQGITPYSLTSVCEDPIPFQTQGIYSSIQLKGA